MAAYTLAVDPGSYDMGAALFKGDKLVGVWSGRGSASKHRVVRCCLMLKDMYVWLDGAIQKEGDEYLDARIHLAYEEPPPYVIAKNKGRPTLERFIGMLEFWGTSRYMEVFGYNVSTIKAGVAGSASASKEEVEAIIKHEFSLHDAQYQSHIWDAIAVGVYHLRMMKIAEAEVANHG